MKAQQLTHCPSCGVSLALQKPKKRYKLGRRSKKRLVGVHPDMVRVVERAIQISEVDFTVLEGKRAMKRQRRLLAEGKSQTLNSRHLTGHAIDLGAWIKGRVSWDWKYYHKIAAAMFQAAAELGISIEWGGNWTSLKDGPHFQLPWKEYPA